MKLRMLVCSIAVLSGLTSCARAPRVDVEAEANAIREISRQWLAAELRKDVKTVSGFYAADAIEMPSNAPAIAGRDSILGWYGSWLSPAGVNMSFEARKIEVAASGDIAYERGTYRFTQESPRGQTDDVGKYITIWRKTDGKWQVAVDIANSDRPCRP